MFVYMQVHMIVENKVNLKVGAVCCLRHFLIGILGFTNKLDWLASEAHDSEDQISVLMFVRKHFMGNSSSVSLQSSTVNFLNWPIPKMC